MPTTSRFILASPVIIPFFLLSGCCTVCKTVTFQAPVGADGVQRVDIVAGTFYFKPNRIIVKSGVPVELSVRKAGRLVPHDIVARAPEAGISFAEALSVEPKTIRFTPSKPGSYPVYCSRKFLWMSHRGEGMEAVIEVVE